VPGRLDDPAVREEHLRDADSDALRVEIGAHAVDRPLRRERALDHDDTVHVEARGRAAVARRGLRPSGALVVETAGGDQATATAALFRGTGWSEVAVRDDLAGVGRFVAGRV